MDAITSASSKNPDTEREPTVAGGWACALETFLGHSSGTFQPHLRYAFSEIAPLWSRIRDTRGEEGGLLFGQWLSPSVAPELHRRLLMSDSLGDALMTLASQLDRLSEAGRLVVVDQPDKGVSICYLPWSPLLAHLDLQIEAAVTSVIRVFHWLTEQIITPKQVTLMHRLTERHRKRLSNAMGCVVKDGASHNAIYLRAQDLALNVRGAREGWFADIATSAPGGHSRVLVGQVEQRILGAVLASGRATRAQVAREIGLSERTLLRRLAAEGETFREVHDRVIRAVILELLRRTDLGLEKMALLTGYADSAAFTRGVRRLLGTTPVAFRKSEQVY
ncbi:MAG: AraC family transcriptional regulator [Gammaproteobacteria bacterium]|nr:MAG: AraC family transcriptional regulator [Gammaproteobacteria bacterium]